MTNTVRMTIVYHLVGEGRAICRQPLPIYGQTGESRQSRHGGYFRE
jgi:hypothetical protein